MSRISSTIIVESSWSSTTFEMLLPGLWVSIMMFNRRHYWYCKWKYLSNSSSSSRSRPKSPWTWSEQYILHTSVVCLLNSSAMFSIEAQMSESLENWEMLVLPWMLCSEIRQRRIVGNSSHAYKSPERSCHTCSSCKTSTTSQFHHFTYPSTTVPSAIRNCVQWAWKWLWSFVAGWEGGLF